MSYAGMEFLSLQLVLAVFLSTLLLLFGALQCYCSYCLPVIGCFEGLLEHKSVWTPFCRTRPASACKRIGLRESLRTAAGKFAVILSYAGVVFIYVQIVLVVSLSTLILLFRALHCYCSYSLPFIGD